MARNWLPKPVLVALHSQMCGPRREMQAPFGTWKPPENAGSAVNCRFLVDASIGAEGASARRSDDCYACFKFNFMIYNHLYEVFFSQLGIESP